MVVVGVAALDVEDVVIMKVVVYVVVVVMGFGVEVSVDVVGVEVGAVVGKEAHGGQTT